MWRVPKKALLLRRLVAATEAGELKVPKGMREGDAETPERSMQGTLGRMSWKKFLRALSAG